MLVQCCKSKVDNIILSMEIEIHIRICKAATTIGRLSKRAWDNKMLTKTTTKIMIYEACELSTPRHRAES